MTPKNQRRLDAAVAGLFGERAFTVPTSLKAFKGIDVLRRQLPLSSGRALYFTDVGVAFLRVVAEILSPKHVQTGLIDHDDVFFACRKVISELLSDERTPDDGEEFATLVAEELVKQVKRFTFVVPMSGLSLDGVDAMPLGELRLLKPSAHILADCITSDDLLERAMKQMQRDVWLCGTEQGTPSVARRKYLEKAGRVAGLLSLAAASCVEWGATPFCVTPVVASAQNSRSAIWLSFPDDSKMLTVHHNFGDNRQVLKISDEFYKQLEEGDWFSRLVELINRQPRNEVEEALLRAIYWFSDAQRDPVREMQLVKFWSCIECFFSFERKKTKATDSVIKGLAAVMVLGGYQFVAVAEHKSLKKRINALYEKRSIAVHDAQYGHVTQRAVADLSRWAAWLIINVMALGVHGYTTRALLLEQSLHLDGVLARGHAERDESTSPSTPGNE